MMIAGEIIAEGDLKGGKTYNPYIQSINDFAIFLYVKCVEVCNSKYTSIVNA